MNRYPINSTPAEPRKRANARRTSPQPSIFRASTFRQVNHSREARALAYEAALAVIG
ncbi:MAG TPA: hypothetical protein VMK31_02570 [Sphingomicrobium sp.]|nr:hypothetical protein [Sphingomicrobium sp.]